MLEVIAHQICHIVDDFIIGNDLEILVFTPD